MQIQCPYCGNACEVDGELTNGQHLVCPFCSEKFLYSDGEQDAEPDQHGSSLGENNNNTIAIKCPYCGAGYEVDKSYEGVSCQCSVCNKDFVASAVQPVVAEGSVSTRTEEEKVSPAESDADETEKQDDRAKGKNEKNAVAIKAKACVGVLFLKAKAVAVATKDKTVKTWKNSEGTRRKIASKAKATAITAKDKTIELWSRGNKGKVSICVTGSMAGLMLVFWMFWGAWNKLDSTGVKVQSCVQLWADGPYWAKTNIGATSPEEAGLYFWWGDTKGQMPSDGSFQVSFNNDNCPTADKSESDLKSAGWLTGGGILAPEHDAAHVYLGGAWRLPTKEDFQNLLDNCHWIWTFKNGTKGYVVRGKGAFSEASIFLPCTCSGMRNSLTPSDSSCFYWSRDGNTFFVDFSFDTRGVCRLFQYWVGLPIRPVTSEYTRSASEMQELTDRIKNEQDANSEYTRGLSYELGSGSDMTEASECYLRAAKLGSDSAQFKLGCLYRDGKGVKKDLQKSVEWYGKAAEQGYPIAQFSLGVCYKIGRGVEKNEFTAAEWFEKAARQCYAPAQYFLGDCFDYGRGVICISRDGDPRTAVKWYGFAAKQGNADAQFQLGCCYLMGRGVQQNKTEAVRWLRKAAEQGHSKAQEFLWQCQ